MNCPKELKAKRKQTLYGHLSDCLQVMQYALPERSWENAFSRLGYDAGFCRDLLAFLICIHDIGKATERWQKYLDNGEGRITHSLFSMLIMREIMGLETSRTLEGSAALLAVLAHHSMLHEGAYSGDSITGLGEQIVPVEAVNKILSRLRKDIMFGMAPLKSAGFTGATGSKIVAALRSRVQEMRPGEKLCFKALYTIFLSALQLCDNEASYQYRRAVDGYRGDALLGAVIPKLGPHSMSGFPKLNDVDNVSHEPYPVKWRYISMPGSAYASFINSLPGRSPNEMQKAVAQAAKPFLILQAGCGTGKTAAALHFINTQVSRGEADRGIITLPTRFTVNSLFWDFHSRYGFSPAHTGIYHGELESVLLSGREEEEERDRHFLDLKFENSFFNRPLNVCTVDHLLYSLLHCHKYADRAFGNIVTSAVVFDEIHYYDEFTLSKIGQCMQLLRQLKVPHMIMSATIPKTLVDHLREDAMMDGTQYTFIHFKPNTGSSKTSEAVKPDGAEDAFVGQDEILYSWKEEIPFKIVKMERPVLNSGNVSGELLTLLEENLSLRQMVVVNQVERAKAVAREVRRRWPRVNVVCYHSEFSRQDRGTKEKVIRALFRPLQDRSSEDKEVIAAGGFTAGDQVILVSTQICEMSLDISADVMYSEIAPADAVAQRGGRLHRRGRLPRSGTCRCPQCQRLSPGFEYCLYLFPLPWDDYKSHLPYKSDGQGQSLLKRSWEVIGDLYSYSNITRWVDEVYSEAPAMEDGAMGEMIREDAVFGRRPAERFGDEYGDASRGSFRVRHSDVATAVVVPASFLPKGVFDPIELVKNKGVQVSLRKLRRWHDNWWVQKVQWEGAEYKVNVLDLPYNEEYGFEFKVPY